MWLEVAALLTSLKATLAAVMPIIFSLASKLRPLGLLVALALVAGPPPAMAQTASREAIEARFQTWLAEQIWPDAQARGVSRATFDRAVEGVAIDWSLPDLQSPDQPPKPPGPQRQPEFLSPGRYLAEGQLATLTKTGRRLLSEWRQTLDTVERRHGVPREIVVAIWGRESGFGRVALPHGAVRALATQAFMSRRKAFFRPELIAALQILEEGHVPPGSLKSSWAGAMGQPQFLPSKFLSHAVDFDGDGRRDIWRSVPDSLASIASYLRGHGWQPGRHWGHEIRVPPLVSCTLEGPDKGKPMAEWARLGVSRVDRQPIVRGDGDRRGFLLMPAGRLGPAFLVSENFYVLKQYNESDLYALFIGHVADRFGSETPISERWAAPEGFTRADVQAMQERLIRRGYEVGGADGLVGFATRVAIGLWQTSQGLEPTCFPTAELVRSVR